MRSVLCVVAVFVAVPAFAVDGTAVRELDVKKLKVAVPGFDDSTKRQTVIRTAEDLAASTAFLDDASREAIKKQVDFSKEKLVVITWWGSSSSSAQAAVARCGKRVAFTIVTSDPALADMRPHVAVFAVPLDMTIESEKMPDLVPMSLQDVKIDSSNAGQEPKPIEIKSADELAKTEVFADQASRDAIKGRVDFSKDKLVVFVWGGSRSDKFVAEMNKKGKTAVFTYTAGVTDDLRRHTRVFTLLRECEVKVVNLSRTKVGDAGIKELAPGGLTRRTPRTL